MIKGDTTEGSLKRNLQCRVDHNMENTCDIGSQFTRKSVVAHIKNGYG